TKLTCRGRLCGPGQVQRLVRHGKIRVSATAAKVDPHLLMPAGAVLLVFDAAGDEVWSAVAVPVRHANAGDRLATIGDEQLRRAELRLPLRADVAAPVHPARAPTSPEAQDQVR